MSFIDIDVCYIEFAKTLDQTSNIVISTITTWRRHSLKKVPHSDLD